MKGYLDRPREASTASRKVRPFSHFCIAKMTAPPLLRNGGARRAAARESAEMEDLLIVGGGAAGLMAAICAKEENPSCRVAMIEGGERVGKKLLSTGNGRCNLTNVNALPADYAPAKVERVFSQLPPDQVMEKFEEMGLLLRVEDAGRVYPISDAASSVLDTLRLTAAHLSVVERTNFSVENAKRTRNGFLLTSADGQKIEGKRLILSCGGKAAAKFTGYGIAEQLGHSVTELKPALLPLKCDVSSLKGLNGVRVKGVVSLFEGKTLVHREEGEILFKDFGLSGIAVFNLSRFFARRNGKCEVEMDLLPQMSDMDAESYLLARAKSLAWRDADGFFLGMFHKNIGMNLLKSAGISGGKVGDIPKVTLQSLARQLKRWRVSVTDTQGGFQSAQVTVGGVPLCEVDENTLASKKCPGLYLAGEVLDVDGPCGGYNLQWAWCSGAATGKAAAK